MSTKKSRKPSLLYGVLTGNKNIDMSKEEQKAVDNYVNNYKVSFSTFSLLVPSLRD